MRLSRGWGRTVRGWSAWRLLGGDGWASPGRLGDTAGAWHLRILATDQTAHGATGRMTVQTPPTHPFPLWEFNWTGFLARLAGSKDCFFRD